MSVRDKLEISDKEFSMKGPSDCLRRVKQRRPTDVQLIKCRRDEVDLI
jgi:hypothetical protein